MLMNLALILSVFALQKYNVSFFDLVNQISEILIPWIFVIIPINSYVRVTGRKSFYLVVVLTLALFALSLWGKVQTFFK